MTAMIGVVIIVIVLVVGIPVGILMSGGAGAGVIGFFLRKEADKNHEGSELIDLNG